MRITEWVRDKIFYFDLLLSGVSWHFLFSRINSWLPPPLHISDPASVLLVHRLTAGALWLLRPALAGGGVEHGDQDGLPETSAIPPPLLPCLHWRMNIGGASQIKAELQDGHYESKKLDIGNFRNSELQLSDHLKPPNTKACLQWQLPSSPLCWFSVVLVLGILSIFNLLIVIADWSALLNINNFLTEDGKTEAT